MARTWWSVVAGCVIFAGACGTGSQMADQPGAGQTRAPAAKAPALVTPVKTAAPALVQAPKVACRLLDDPKTRQRLSFALEHKLLVECGRATRSPRATPSPLLKGSDGIRNLAEGALPAAPGTDILVNDPSLDVGGSTQSETSVVAVGSVVCAAWNDAGEGFGANGFAGFGYSLDGGQTFKDGGPFLSNFDTSFGDPSLAYSARDKTFFFASLSSFGLSLWSSSDSCQSFQYIGPINAGYGDDKELMAVDNTPTSPYFGRIYVGWTAFGLGNDINVVSHSDDGGLTWSPVVQLPGSGSSGQGVYPAIAPNGDVYMAFVNQDFSVGGHQDQWIYRSTDGGMTWAKRADIGTDQLRPEDEQDSMDCGRQALGGHIRNLSSPQIVVTADGSAPAGYVIHAVYPYDSDGAGPDHSNVFYRRSVDAGATWSPEVKLNDDSTNADQYYPTIGASEDGVLAVSFYDRRLDPDNTLIDRYLTVSNDGGLTWAPNERVSDVSSGVAQTLPNFDGLAECYHGDYDQLAVSGNVAHVVWSDDRRVTATGPNPDVYYDQYIVNPHLGRLTTSAPGVSCAGSIGFGLSDIDLAGTGTHAIALETSTGDAETLVLTEDAAHPGKFSGSIGTSAGGVVAGNGTLEVADLATITATYEDADDGSGNPATATIQVKADCAAPVLTNVRVSSLSGDTATLSADSSEAASLAADYGYSCGELALHASSGIAPKPSVGLSGLLPGFTYYYVLTATDAFGNATRDDNGGHCYSFTTLSVIFKADFESGLDGFDIPPDTSGGGTGGIGGGAGSGFGGTGIGGKSGTGTVGGTAIGGKGGAGGSDTGATAGAPEAGAPGEGGTGGGPGVDIGGGLWHLTESCAAVATGHSRPAALYYGLDDTCTFATGFTTRGAATSPEIELTDATFASVQFDYYLGTEGGGYYDQASLEISVNDGPFQVVASNFTSLLAPDPDRPPFRTRKGAQPAGRYTLVENSGQWQHSAADLTPYLGGLTSAKVRLRFHFDSLDPIANDFAGFYVDDVKLLGVVPPAPCSTDTDCDDGLYCTGTEKCVGGTCAKGQPVVCTGGDDGIACTDFACDEAARGCVQVPHDEVCDDGSFCNGSEICNPTSGCQAGTPVTCSGGDVTCVQGVCREDLKSCATMPDDSLCDDGSFCDGYEYCDSQLGCQQTPPPCVDGVACTDDLCDEQTYSCSFVPNDAYCNDGLFCDGTEYCDGYQGCRTSGPPCGPDEKCDEGGDQCIPACFTDTNVNHQAAGRAYAKRASYFAKGSNDTLGKGSKVTSLQGGGDYWERVSSCPAPPVIDSVNVSISGTIATVSGAASDPNDDIVKVRLTFYVYLSFAATLDAVGTTNFSGNLSLPPGVHGVTVQAFDAAGFASAPSEMYYFEILQPAPPSIDSLTAEVSNGKVTVSGTASDPNDDITQVQLTIVKDGTVVASQVATGLTNFSGTIAGLGAGSYTARAQATDSFGFVSALATAPFDITLECYADTNGHHLSAGRAELKRGAFYAVGSHDALGRRANQLTSLSGSGGYWSKVDHCP